MFLDIERAAALLEDHPDYRVVRRLVRPAVYCVPPPGVELRTGVLLDLETTGLSPHADAIIEVGILQFTFTGDGTVCEITGELSALEDPERPLPEIVQRLTGLTDADLAGQRIDDAAVRELVAAAAVVIAHNAAFDRPFAEKRWRFMENLWWGCSMAEVPWSDLGIESNKLEYVAYRFANVFGATHRALSDCELALHVLAQRVDERDTTALGLLLQNSRQRTWRIRAQGAPIEHKDALKARRYRWSQDMRTWYIDVPDAQRAEEHRWLADECGVRMPFDTPVDGRLRYSLRIPGGT